MYQHSAIEKIDKRRWIQVGSWVESMGLFEEFNGNGVRERKESSILPWFLP
jgi:hypothetical protein